MTTQSQQAGRYPRLRWQTMLVLSLATVLSSHGYAAGDDGSPITLNDLTQDGPQIPTEFTGDPMQHDELANFAWREFIALNSPAGTLPANRGIPDANRSFVDSGKPNFYSSGKQSGQIGTNLLVWETYAHRTELFPYYTTPPASPAAFAKNPNYQFAPPSGGSVPTFGSGVLQLYNNLDESSQIGQNILFFPRNPPNAASNPFDDIQVLFEAKVNQIEYDYGQTLNANSATNLRNNSVEVKAAWRLITSGVDASRYHTAEAVYYTGPEDAPVANNGTFGLVGLHIIQKTANYPTFIFATFEQIDALTQPNGKATGLYYISDYTSLGYDPATGNSPTATINNGSGQYVSTALPVANSNLPAGSGLPSGHAGPVKVVQPATITKSVTMVNQQVQGLISGSSQFNDSVWRYYQLKGVQAIPINEPSPSSTPSADSLDYYLANIVVESSQPGIQLFKGGVIGPGDGSIALQPTDFINNRSTDSYAFPASKPTDQPYCGDFEGIDWPAAGQTVAVPRGYTASSYKPKQGVPGALFAGPYQWGGTRCGGTCTNNGGNNPICYISANATNVTKADNTKVTMGGCMGCHGQAQQAGVDFSFLFFSKGGAGFSADVMGEVSTEELLERGQSYLPQPTSK
ncbi:MAG: hypothetical protein Tsb002_06460 [Wenzhouxiangellaceae bacterium]